MTINIAGCNIIIYFHIKENIKKLLELQRQVLIRIPLINGFNAEPAGFTDFFRGYNTGNVQFELLPYHEYGKVKWTEEYKIKDGFVTEDVINKFIDAFTREGYQCSTAWK